MKHYLKFLDLIDTTMYTLVGVAIGIKIIEWAFFPANFGEWFKLFCMGANN